jgi:hypothetical protein
MQTIRADKGQIAVAAAMGSVCALLRSAPVRRC